MATNPSGLSRVLSGLLFGLGVIQCGLLSLCCGFGAYTSPAKIHVLAPPSADMRVVVDGGAPVVVAAGTSEAIEVPRGPHEIVFDPPDRSSRRGRRARRQPPVTSVSVDLTLWAPEVFVGGPGRCFSALDVTDVAYGSVSSRVAEAAVGAEPAAPRVVWTKPGDEPVYSREASSVVWAFDIEGLPERLRKRQQAHLIVESDCALEPEEVDR